MERGQPFSDEDVEQARRVCVIGQTVAKELFGDEDPLGKDIRIKDVMFKVIGILKKKGANMMGRDQDDSIILPWTSIRYRLQGLGGWLRIRLFRQIHRYLQPGGQVYLFFRGLLYGDDGPAVHRLPASAPLQQH